MKPLFIWMIIFRSPNGSVLSKKNFDCTAKGFVCSFLGFVQRFFTNHSKIILRLFSDSNWMSGLFHFYPILLCFTFSWIIQVERMNITFEEYASYKSNNERSKKEMLSENFSNKVLNICILVIFLRNKNKQKWKILYIFINFKFNLFELKNVW